MKPSGLGKGLGSLIPDRKLASEKIISTSATPDTVSGRVLEISPEVIEANPRQPRVHFSPSDLEDLIASIKQFGIIQPLIVTQTATGYQLIAGERRLRAAKTLGLEAVPVVVRTASEQEKLELALIENIQRQDLNPVEEARAYKALLDTFGLTQEDVARRVGKSRSAVANTLRLLDLNEEMLKALAESEITRSHARALLAQTDVALRHQMFLQMLGGEMTVHQAEAMGTKKAAKRTDVAKDANVLSQERSLEALFHTKVRIEPAKDGSGKIVLHYYSQDEYFAILDILGTVAVAQ